MEDFEPMDEGYPVMQDKQSITKLFDMYDKEERPNLYKKLEIITKECDYFRPIKDDGSSFWHAYLIRLVDLNAKKQLNIDRIESIMKMQFNNFHLVSNNLPYLIPNVETLVCVNKNLGIVDLGIENLEILISWLKHATVGYILDHEDRFNRWLTRDNFRSGLYKQLRNFKAAPDETLMAAFAELFQLNVRIYPLDNSPLDDFVSYGYRGAPDGSGKESDFILLQEDCGRYYQYKLLYQDSEDLPRLMHNLCCTTVAFNGMSSVTGFDSAANSGSGVPCASKPDGTVVVDEKRPLLSEKEDINNVVAEYNDQSSPEFFTKMKDVAKRYKWIRRIRGDGACYWRCLLISIVEKCIGDHELKQLCSEMLEKLPKVGYDFVTAEDFINTFVEGSLDKILEGNQQEAFDTLQDISYHIFITAGYILLQGDEYLPNALAEDYPNLKEYVDARIQVFETPADDVAICASARVFDLNIRIEYVTRDNRSMDEKGSFYLLPYEDLNAHYSIFLLWRPEHYDILYKE